jgi:hypothetical protein
MVIVSNRLTGVTAEKQQHRCNSTTSLAPIITQVFVHPYTYDMIH